MTIIEPKNNKKVLTWPIAGLVLVMLLMAYWNISVYNQTVDLRHAIDSGSEKMQTLKVLNSDLKNQLYLVTDSKNLIELARERGLVKVASPEYIEVDSKWSVVSASHF